MDVMTLAQIHVKTLLNANRLSSSYLFSGNNVDEKIVVAKQMLKFQLCKSHVDLMPCNQCDQCLVVNDQVYYGFHLLGAEDDSSSLKVDQMRALRKQLLLTGNDSWTLVYVTKAHRLTPTASNSILKLLEEAPPKVFFIFDIPNAHLLLPTIRSRSQVVHFGDTLHTTFKDLAISDIMVDEFWETITSQSVPNLFSRFESAKQSRDDVKEYFRLFKMWCLTTFKTTQDKRYIDAIPYVEKYENRLDRPVHVMNNLCGLVLELKQIINE
jgi:hypothetical protein